MPLVSLDHVSLAFGHLPLLDDVSVQIEPRERVSIIGRNGTGKSTLLQVMSGELHPDVGTVWHQPAVRLARCSRLLQVLQMHLGGLKIFFSILLKERLNQVRQYFLRILPSLLL